MNTVEAKVPIKPIGDSMLPKMTQRLGNTTYEVHVHFSKTSQETLTDKIMRLIRNDTTANDVS